MGKGIIYVLSQTRRMILEMSRLIAFITRFMPHLIAILSILWPKEGLCQSAVVIE
jgi:hypothetical protein